MTTLENRIYDLEYEINALTSKHDVSRDRIMEVMRDQSQTPDEAAKCIHFVNEFDLLSVSAEVLEKMSAMCDRAKKYDMDHKRGRKPTTHIGLMRSRIRREVAIRGLTGDAIESSLKRPAGWYEKISTGKQGLDLVGLVGIAAFLGVTCEYLLRGLN